MDVAETKPSSRYGKPPWIFKGRAFYQLNLVKAELARAFIPKEFRLVEAFGYTLGGFFLASYDESPAGVFDELVVIAGIVWNPPTSCAWAARVLVNSDEACIHGRKDVGLPSQVARFSKRITAVPRKRQNIVDSLLSIIGMGHTFYTPKAFIGIELTETEGPALTEICKINLMASEFGHEHGLKFNEWMGPAIRMCLPSFSGRTEYNPNLLKYSCQIECRVRAVQPARVTGQSQPTEETDKDQSATEELSVHGRNLRNTIAVMLSKPVLALEFNCLQMQVEAPIVVSQYT